MNLLPQHAQQRAARLQLGEGIPAVLRDSEGGCNQASLKTVSLTGGLLSVPQDLEQGSSFKLMFVTHTGPVLGTAEMLDPVDHHLQPFRFVSLHQSDKRKLGEAIRTCLEPDDSRQQWIEKYRTVAAERDRRELHRKRNLYSIATIVTFALAGFLYFFRSHLFHSYFR
jgi:hypothetical protein